MIKKGKKEKKGVKIQDNKEKVNKSKKEGFLGRLKKSFFVSKECIMVYSYDLLFYGIVIPIFLLFSYILNNKMSNIDLSLLVSENIASQSPETIFALNSSLQSLLVTSVLLVVLYIIILIISYSLSRGLCYCSLIGKKFTKHYMLKMVLLNSFYAAAIFLLFFLPFVIFLSTISTIFTMGNLSAYILASAMMIIWGFIVYIISLSYIIFTDEKAYVFDSIGKALKLGVSRFKDMAGCLGIIFLGFIITGYIVNMIDYPLAGIIIFVMFTTWARRYFVNEVKGNVL